MNNQISKNIREAVEGVVIDNYFLSENDFINFFMKAWRKEPGNPLSVWRDGFRTELQYLTDNYTMLLKNSPMRAYTIWENITIKYFNNTPVSILAATNLEQSTDNIKVYANTMENFVLTKKSHNEFQTSRDKLKNKDRLKGNITNDVANTILKNHYWEMANTIMKEKPEDPEIKEALNNKQITDYSRHKLEQALDATMTNRYLFYKQVFGQKNYGQIWEAYIHHLAHLHGWYLTIQKLNTIATKSARQEEYPNFLNLLYDASNSLSFTRGGDVIIVDNNQRVITNVQIKGTQKNPAKFGNPISKNTTLDQYLTPLLTLFNKKTLNEEEIRTLFNALKNTAWIEKNVDKAVQRIDIDQLVQEISENYKYYIGKDVWIKKNF